MARLPQNPYNGYTGKEREAKLRAHGQGRRHGIDAARIES